MACINGVCVGHTVTVAGVCDVSKDSVVLSDFSVLLLIGMSLIVFDCVKSGLVVMLSEPFSKYRLTFMATLLSELHS